MVGFVGSGNINETRGMVMEGREGKGRDGKGRERVRGREGEVRVQTRDKERKGEMGRLKQR